MIVIAAIVWTKGKKYKVASGKKGINTLKNPYVENFKIVPANNTDPANGEYTWALNSQPVNGHRGVLIAKAIKNPQD